nr:uncharacterized protein LOC109153105 [Ipomoea batatas]
MNEPWPSEESAPPYSSGKSDTAVIRRLHLSLRAAFKEHEFSSPKLQSCILKTGKIQLRRTMFIKGDYNLKFGPRHDECPGEVLKFGMYKQEDTFRKQVSELHQAKLDDTILRSRLGPFSCYTEPVPVPVEKTFCPIPVANEEHRGILTGIQQNLSSPRDCFTRYVSDKGRDPLAKGYYCCSSRQPTETNHFLHDEAATFSLEEVDLSLSIGRNNQKMRGSNKVWNHVIDSKESNKICTNAGVKTLSAPGCAAYFGDTCDLKSNSSLTNELSRNQSNGNQISHSSVNVSTSFLEKNFSNEGVEQCYEQHIPESKPTMGKPFPFRDGALLDLNIPLLDESSFHRDNVGGLVSSDSEDLSNITKEPETHLRNSSNEAFQNTDPSRAAKSTAQRDVKSSDNSDMRFQKGKAAEVDDQTQEGASTLIYFMSECLREQCHTIEASKPDNREHERNLQPECSDSFEANCLKLTECSVDDYCVSSEPFEVNTTDKKDYGITLRRGRRMKDFRKDILPSLASLARHEISEDMHLMHTILRSREYKKNRSKMKGRENEFKTTRNRRSR